MDEKDKSAGDEFKEWVWESLQEFIHWLRPNPNDGLLLKIVKSILKIPVALFMIIISPVLILILGIIFVILL